MSTPPYLDIECDLGQEERKKRSMGFSNRVDVLPIGRICRVGIDFFFLGDLPSGAAAQLSLIRCYLPGTLLDC